MTLKIISFIFIISLAFGIQNPTQVKDVPFDVNKVINRVSHHSLTSESQPFEQGEFLIDTNIVYVIAENDQFFSSIAFDGTNYLVVWADGRSGDFDIYGTLVSRAGEIINPLGFPISTSLRRQVYPSVAFDGVNYFVVWEDERNGEYEFDIYGTRVTQTGIVLDSNGIAVSITQDDQENPSVTFNGINYLVVWENNRNGDYDIYGARISQAGIVLDPNGIAISTAIDWQWLPSVTSSDTHFFVVWADSRNGNSDIYGARISPTGVLLDSNGIAISTALASQLEPSVAFDGTNYFVVWKDYHNGDYSDIYGTRVSQTGVVLDPTGISISNAEDNQEYTEVAFDGTNYLVVWTDWRNWPYDIYGARVSRAGYVLDPNGIVITTAENEQYFPVVAFDGTNYLITWTDRRNGPYSDIYGTRFTRTGNVLDPNGILISATIYPQYNPSLAFDGSNFLIVWTDWRNGDYDIYGAMVSQTGVVIHPNGIPISTHVDWQKYSAVTFGGTNYLVVWEDWRSLGPDIYGTRVNRIGNILDSNGITISNADSRQGEPAVTFDSINYLVVWHDLRNYSYYDIYGARVTQTSNVLDPNGLAISAITEEKYLSSVAFDGTNYLIVYTDFRNGWDADIYATRVSQTGTVLDSNGIAISTFINWQVNPSIAFDGTNYLVVWQDWRNGYPDIYGARISPSGIVLDPEGIAISTAEDDQVNPSIVFDGTNYLVVWQDKRNGNYDIYGARVSSFGVVIDSFMVSTQAGNQESPALARGIENQVLITYSGWVGIYQGRTYNTTRIWGKFYPFVPEIKEGNSEVKIQTAKLLEVYPNPFSRQTAIRFTPNASRIELKIYDISGKLVKSFSTSPQPPSPSHCLMWNGTDDSDRKLPAGVYFCCLKTPESTSETKEIIIMR